jgi:hypothetical protein
MSWHLRKSHGARPVAFAAAVAGIVLVSVAGGSSSDAATSRPGSVRAAAYYGCSPLYPYRVNFYSNGVLVPDLTVCTNLQRSATTITNTSDSVTWHVNQPWDPYWRLSEDSDSSLSNAALLFRAWLNTIRSPHRPIEPGVKATLSAPPDTIQLGHNAGEQAAWQVTSLIADSLADKWREPFIGILKDTAIGILKDTASPTGKAVIECAQDAYNIGQSLHGEDQPQDIQSLLSTGLGIYQGGKNCGQAVYDAQHAAESHGENPLVSLENIQKKARFNGGWKATGTLVSDAVKFIEIGARVHV